MSPLPALTVAVPTATIEPPVCRIGALVVVRPRVPSAVTSLASVIAPLEVSATVVPRSVPTEVSGPPLVSVSAAVPVSIGVAGRVNAPPATTLTAWFGALVSPLRASAFASTMLTAPPVTPRVAKSLPPSASVTAPLPALTLLEPLTTAAPDCVTGPLPAAVLTVRLAALIGPSVRPLASVTETAPPIAATLPKLLAALLSVTAPDPALAAVAPLTIAAAFWVMLPLPAAVFSVSEVALIASSASALLSVIETAPPVAPTLAKLFPALVRVIAFVPAFAEVVPLTTTAPFWLIAPPAVTNREPALVASRASALTSAMTTPPPVAPTLPKLFPAMLRLTAPLPALTAVAPVTIAAAFCVTLPLPTLVSSARLDALIAFRASALLSVIATAPPRCRWSRSRCRRWSAPPRRCRR